jgi:PKD repeat protein
VTAGIAPLAVAFTGSAVVTGGCTTAVTYDWDFGDGTLHSSEQSPAHTYTAVGDYAWTLLVVADGSSCTRTGSIAVAPNVPPPAITAMTKLSPFGIIVTGSNLQNGIRVFISGTEWTNVQWKNTGKVKILGGGSLKAAVPKGSQKAFRFLNPDGGEAFTTWGW